MSREVEASQVEPGALSDQARETLGRRRPRIIHHLTLEAQGVDGKCIPRLARAHGRELARHACQNLVGEWLPSPLLDLFYSFPDDQLTPVFRVR